jgi:hypothetical protein
VSAELYPLTLQGLELPDLVSLNKRSMAQHERYLKRLDGIDSKRVDILGIIRVGDASSHRRPIPIVLLSKRDLVPAEVCRSICFEETPVRFGYGNGELIKLSFRIEEDYGLHILESPLSEDQQVHEAQKRYQISATVIDSAMLDWWLRGFGKAVSKISKTKSNRAHQSSTSA